MNSIEISFTRTSTKIGTMAIVDPQYSANDIIAGVAAGTLVITFGGQDRWGSIWCRDAGEHVVAHILDADDDAAGANYSKLEVINPTGASHAS